MELELKRARLEEKQMEIDAQMGREERQFQLQMMNMLTHNNQGNYVAIECSNAFYVWVRWLVGVVHTEME